MNELLEKSLRNKVERLDAFEERLSVRFESISIRIIREDAFSLICELHSSSGTTIEKDIKVECVLYDKEGLILETKSTPIFEDEFFGFEVIDMFFKEEGIVNKIGKIRIYPKK